MKGCTIYKISQKLIIVCMHRTDAGFYKLGEPIKVVDSGENEVIGAAILEVINGSQEGLPAHSVGQGIVPMILKAAGIKSWKKFEAETKECYAQLDGQKVQIVPCVRVGNDASMHLTDKLEISESEEEELGGAVLRLLAT